MRNFIIFILIILSIVLLIDRFTSRFYDGEGNEIPTVAVKALVADQFVLVDSTQSALLLKYFNVKADSTVVYP